MVHLTTFGGLGLCDAAGNRIDSILAQPRRLALLTYLAVEARKTRIRRDVVLSVFWPDVDQGRASRALSQAMHFLRNGLGAEVFNKPGCEDIGVNAEQLSCDACHFLAAVESRQHATAVTLYGGDFLRGFYVDDAPDFERWVEEQRSYLRRLASESAIAEARSAAERGHTGAAAAYARRAAELGLCAETVAREQMELLASVGDYAGALEAYEQLRSRLQRELEVDPSAETEALASRLRERAASPITVPAVEPQHLQQPQLHVVPAGPVPWRRVRPQRRGALAIGGTVLASMLSFWALDNPKSDSIGDHTPLLLIDGFREVGAVPAGTGTAITESVVARLSGVQGLVAKHVVAPLTGNQLDNQSEPLVLQGFVSKSGWRNGYDVQVTLLNGITGKGIAQHLFMYDSARFAGSDRPGDDIADFARAEAGRYHRTEQLADLSPRNANAFRMAHQHRARGDSLRGDGQIEPALAAFESADSSLTEVSGGKQTIAKALAERAEIWLAKAWVFFTPQAFDIPSFRKSAIRSLALADSTLKADPRSASALESRGLAAQLLWQTESPDSTAALQRFVEMSEASLRNAVDLAPGRARAWALLGAVLYVQGRYHESLAAAERAYTANAFLEQTSEVLHRLFSAALETGDSQAAAVWCREIARRFGDSWMEADCRLQLLAWSAPSRATYYDAARLVAKHKAQRSQSPMLVARLEMVLGVVGARAGLPLDSALAIQNRAILHSPHDPELAPMRAWFWRTVNRPDSARAVINAYVSADPLRRAGTLKSRRFRVDLPVVADQSLQ